MFAVQREHADIVKTLMSYSSCDIFARDNVSTCNSSQEWSASTCNSSQECKYM